MIDVRRQRRDRESELKSSLKYGSNSLRVNTKEAQTLPLPPKYKKERLGIR